MHNITVEIGNFKGTFAQKEEWIMCRTKNVSLIQVQNILKSNGLFESKSVDEVIFPISLELLVCSRYEDNQRVNFSIVKIQNGKRIPICTADNFLENLLYKEKIGFFNVFNLAIDNFIKKGFQKVVA